MNTPITFELAKLLKEKGFDIPCENRYDESGEFTVTKLGMHMQPNNYSNSYSAPTVAEVVIWLYENKKYGIWIYSLKDNGIKFNYAIQQLNTHLVLSRLHNFNSPLEAYEAAIEYILKNLK